MSVFAASAVEIDIALQPKQDELWRLVDESPYTDIGFGGARGGGKSGGARRIMTLRRLKYPQTDGILLRRTYQELRDNHLTPLFREFPMVRDWWTEKDKALIFPNGSRLLFRYAEHAQDVGKLFGVEYADICPEEAGLFTQKELEMMKGSNRWRGESGIVPKMLYPFMPGGISHHYLKRVFYDRDYEGEERATDYAFIQAYGWDNIEWARKALAEDGLSERDYYSWTDAERRAYFIERTDYGRKLAALQDEQLRKAWLDGSMEITEGAVFPELRDSVHNLDHFVADDQWQDFCAELKKLGALDHASSGVTAYLQEGLNHEGIKFSLEEYYERNKTIAQHAGQIRTLIGRYGEQEYTLIDPSTEAKTLQGKNPQTNQDEMWSVQDEYRRHGVITILAPRTAVSVGLDVLKGLLAIDPGRVHPFTGHRGAPAWFISKKRCPNLWREVRELQKVFDINSKWQYVGSDHALDDARYIAISRPAAPEMAKSSEFSLNHAQQYTSIDQKAARTFGRFDKTFGKEPSENSWFPKA